jgi:hypothetical protein
MLLCLCLSAHNHAICATYAPVLLSERSQPCNLCDICSCASVWALTTMQFVRSKLLCFCLGASQPQKPKVTDERFSAVGTRRAKASSMNRSLHILFSFTLTTVVTLLCAKHAAPLQTATIKCVRCNWEQLKPRWSSTTCKGYTKQYNQLPARLS